MLTHGRFHALTPIVLFLVVFVLASSTVSAQTRRDAILQPITTFAPDAIAQATPRVIRKSDSLINGALIGAGVAVASGLFICTRMEPWEVCRGNVGSILKLGAVGAGIGAGVDALIRGRATIYQSENGTTLHATPLIGRDANGIRLAVTF